MEWATGWQEAQEAAGDSVEVVNENGVILGNSIFHHFLVEN